MPHLTLVIKPSVRLFFIRKNKPYYSRKQLQKSTPCKQTKHIAINLILKC